MKLKALKRRVWCHQTATAIDLFIGNRDDRKNRRSMPARLTCPDCGKRFTPRIRECDDVNCWHIYLPAHKKVVKVPRK